MIDIHTHIGKPIFKKALTPSQLLKFMDKNGIDKAVVLPIENPEETYYYVTTDEVLKACKKIQRDCFLSVMLTHGVEIVFPQIFIKLSRNIKKEDAKDLARRSPVYG